MKLPMPSVCVRGATSDDADAACVAVRLSITDICGPDYDYEEPVMSDWLANKTPDNFRKWIESPDTFSIVAIDGAGDVVGFGQMSRAGCVQLGYIIPEALHQGYGKALLQSMEQKAVQWGLDTVSLQSSITAKAFYEHNGYRLTGKPKLFGGALGDFPFVKELE